VQPYLHYSVRLHVCKGKTQYILKLAIRDKTLRTATVVLLLMYLYKL